MNKIIGTQLPISSLNADQQKAISEGNFSFEETFTVEQFLAEECVDKIQVKHREGSTKLFFTYGAKTGPCAKTVPERPMVSHVIGQAKTKDGQVIPGMAEHMYLLHNEGEGKAIVVATFGRK